MKLTFHGATRSVTGSQHLLEVNGTRILLDCGLFQGKRRESLERNREFPFDPHKVDVLVLSHAHIDHSGNIPNLVKSGFRGDILCTFATRDLCATMLRDSAHIQQYDIEYVNKRRARKGEPLVEPIYTMTDAVHSLEFFLAIGYERPYRITPDITLTFYDAGHILGSAIVALDVRENGTNRRLVFSGDLGRPDAPILRDPVQLDGADILLIEFDLRHPVARANPGRGARVAAGHQRDLPAQRQGDRAGVCRRPDAGAGLPHPQAQTKARHPTRFAGVCG